MITQKWTKEPPSTFDGLFDFYHNYVKVLYSSVQTQNKLPDETLFELNAALDHLSRHWAYKEEESAVVKTAYGHLKRSCLDIFKLKVKEARKQFDELKTIETNIIDNGEYDTKLNNLFSRIKASATEARQNEGNPNAGFTLWEQVYVDCVTIERDFYLHPKLGWAKKKCFWKSVKKYVLGFILGAVTSILSAILWETWLANYFKN